MTNVEKKVIEVGLAQEVNVQLDLPEFLQKKAVFLKDPTPENSGAMKSAYENIYLDFKHAWYRHEITEQDFYQLKKLLQEGL